MATKVKTFQFLVSNPAGNSVMTLTDRSEFVDDMNKKFKVTDEKTIDKTINKWIEKEKADIKDIKVTNYTLDRHNNGFHDSIVLVYTIIYTV